LLLFVLQDASPAKHRQMAGCFHPDAQKNNRKTKPDEKENKDVKY
jgi:hypothetical protein